MIIRFLFGQCQTRQIKLEVQNMVSGEVFNDYMEFNEISHFRKGSTLRSYLSNYMGSLGPHVGSMIDTYNSPFNQLTNVMSRRELILDIDLTDYNKAKNPRQYFCHCQDSMCSQCWLFVEIAAPIFQAICTKQRHLGPMLSVFSGGKGCHFWWGSSQVHALLPVQRNELYDTMNNPPKTMDKNNETIRIMYQTWEERGIVHRALLGEMVLDDNPLANLFKDTLPPLVKMMFSWPTMGKGDMDPANLSLKRWRFYLKQMGKDNFPIVLQTICQLVWPRIDQKVLKEPGKIIKAPFTIHKSTKKPSFPLRNVNDCIPEKMPTIDDLYANIHSSMYTPICTTANEIFKTWLDDSGY